MKNAAFGFLFALCCFASLAASPVIMPPALSEIRVKAPNSAKPGSLVVLSADGIEESRYTWDLRYPSAFEQYQEENGKLFLAMPAESVGVTLFVIPNDQNKPIKKIRYTIEAEQGNEPPKPIAQGIKKTDWLVLVEDSNKRSEEVAKIANSTLWLLDLPEMGYNAPLVYDYQSKEGEKFCERAKLDPPFFAVMDESGEFVKATAATEEALKGLLGK